MQLHKNAWRQELNKSCKDSESMKVSTAPIDESFFWQLHHSDPSTWKKHTDIIEDTELNYQGKVFYKSIPGYTCNIYKTELLY
jgi:hypothetical protein